MAKSGPGLINEIIDKIVRFIICGA